MYVWTRKELDTLTAAVPVLGQASRKGLSATELASRTGVDQQRLERLLAKHTDYFVRVGQSEAFALNTFGRFAASADAILEDAERRYREGRKRAAAAAAFVVVVLGLAVLA